LNNEHHMRRS